MTALLILMLLLYPALAHWSIHQGNPQYAVYLLGLICLVLALMTMLRARNASPGSIAVLLLGLVLLWFPNWQGIHLMQLVPVVINGLLGALFISSLGAGKTPLITRIASLMRGGIMPEPVAGYTRKVTVAWALLFVLLAVSNLLLAIFAPLATWSLFANLLNYLLIAGLFALEFVFRRWYLGELIDYSFGEFIKGLVHLDYGRIFRGR